MPCDRLHEGPVLRRIVGIVLLACLLAVGAGTVMLGQIRASLDQPAGLRTILIYTVPPPYAGASRRIVRGRGVEPRKPPVRRRGRGEVSTYQGICRGC